MDDFQAFFGPFLMLAIFVAVALGQFFNPVESPTRIRKQPPKPRTTAPPSSASSSPLQWWNVLEKFFRGNDGRAEGEEDEEVRGWRRMKLLHDRLTAASTEATMHI